MGYPRVTFEEVQKHGIFEVGQIWEASDHPFCKWSGPGRLVKIRQWSDGKYDCEFKVQWGFVYVAPSELIRVDDDTGHPIYRLDK